MWLIMILGIKTKNEILYGKAKIKDVIISYNKTKTIIIGNILIF